MKCVIPEISWHNRDPVLSIDIQSNYNDFYRLATGGADCHVLIWQLKILECGKIDIEVVSDLTRHQRAVNVVRWSPSGQYLASADDEASIIIWYLKTDNIPLLEGETNDKEVWLVFKVLRGHKEDIYDLCWSPDGLKLLTGSIDNTAIIWDFEKGKIINILTAHKGFVQGVAWDPKGEFVATISSDRICRLFDKAGKQSKAKVSRGKLPVPESHPLFDKEVKYFHDDTFKSYFRRLDFSPDGNLLVTPSGCVETEDNKKALYASYIFTLDSFNRPAAILSSPKRSTIAVKCCPLLFELRPNGPDPIIKLPYRMIIAVATDSDVILYDTQQISPFAYFQKIHYTRLTDLTWSKDGLLLIASSTDGFCTLITFEKDELGEQYIKDDSEAEENILNISGCEELDKNDISKEDTDAESKKVKRPSFLDQWTIKGQKKVITEDTASVKDCDENKKNTLNIQNINKLTPRRITPVKISETTVDKNKASVAVIDLKKTSSENSPAKQGSLLNFLKKTSNRNSSNKNDKKLAPNANHEDACVVVDEIEARDAWKCEKEETTDNKSTINDSISIVEDEDSLRLVLESTSTLSDEANETLNKGSESEKGNDGSCTTKNLGKSEEIILNNDTVKDMEVNEIISTNDETDKAKPTTNSKENKVIAKNDNDQGKVTTETNASEDKAVLEKPIQKRRIPLITLSSPKAKYKKKQDESSS